ncbi:MAG: hypothetical protein JWO30_2489 [Fibrobacteres bacterium]|nr:hypothetical protein [Fibrobacterota bacterium]
MNSLPTRGLRALILGLPLLAAACVFFTQDDKTAKGGGSDTETLTGLVSSPSGRPAVGASVKLIPADYDPSHPDTSLIRYELTDDSGRFRFEKIDTGRAYNVIAGEAAEKSWAFAAGLRAGPGTDSLTLALAKVFLFSLHAENYQIADSGIAYFPGTDILTRCGGLKPSTVDSVPAGAMRFVVESRAGWAHDTTLASVADTAKVAATKSGVTVTP